MPPSLEPRKAYGCFYKKYGRSEVMWLLSLGQKKQYSFCLVLSRDMTLAAQPSCCEKANSTERPHGDVSDNSHH